MNKLLPLLILITSTIFIGCKKETPERLSLDGSWKAEGYSFTYLKWGIEQTFIMGPLLASNIKNATIAGSSLTFGPDYRPLLDTTKASAQAVKTEPQFSSFTVKQSGVSKMTISWNTVSPQDLDHLMYEVQWSSDGMKFWRYQAFYPNNFLRDTMIHEIADIFPPHGDLYYRLKIIYKDNTYSFSPVLKADFNPSHNLVKSGNSYSLHLPYPLLDHFTNLKFERVSDSTMRVLSRVENVFVDGAVRPYVNLELRYKRQK